MAEAMGQGLSEGVKIWGKNPRWINEPAVVYSEATKVHNEALTKNRLGEKLEFDKRTSRRRIKVSLFRTRTVKSNQTDTWPFDQPRNCATFTMRQVVDGSEPILLVSHDEEDHGWQFIGSSDVSMADAKLVCLEEIVRIDPTVQEVADLPPGWQAIRERVGGAWTRREHPPVPEDER